MTANICLTFYILQISSASSAIFWRKQVKYYSAFVFKETETERWCGLSKTTEGGNSRARRLTCAISHSQHLLGVKYSGKRLVKFFFPVFPPLSSPFSRQLWGPCFPHLTTPPYLKLWEFLLAASCTSQYPYSPNSWPPNQSTKNTFPLPINSSKASPGCPSSTESHLSSWTPGSRGPLGSTSPPLGQLYVPSVLPTPHPRWEELTAPGSLCS